MSLASWKAPQAESTRVPLAVNAVSGMRSHVEMYEEYFPHYNLAAGFRLTTYDDRYMYS